ncbi:hypothetical protein [Flammeovirga sp. SubArs3]|uniref:hypothetical protein n=1 Tax=Flammeovirga sp. SubArs3 TaxID=2995316 RepID=UPI00248C690E|nr:hypothetical protein [Flammeovirga sp. SubArs3]
MKVTSWRKLDNIWKEIILLSIKVQEENIEHSKVISLLQNTQSASETYTKLFEENLVINDWPDFTFFNRLLPLEKIFACYLPIEGIDPIIYFPLTKIAHFEGTEVFDLDPLILTSSLQELYLDNTYVDDLVQVMNLPLKKLSLKGLNIEQSQLETVLLRQPNCEIIA